MNPTRTEQPEPDTLHLTSFFGIFTHSLSKSKPLLTKLTLTLILPLAITFLSHIQISHRFFPHIENPYVITSTSSFPRHVSLSDWLLFSIFKIAYFTLLTLFSLLSTASVVFTVASGYTARDVTFRRLVTAVVPNVWKKLFVTFVYIYFWLFVYNVVSGGVMYATWLLFGYTVFGSVILFVIFILYVLGFLYLTVVWQLTSVVTVLEKIRGFKALKKGKMLASGKTGVGMGIAFILYAVLLGVILVYELFVEFGGEFAQLAMVWRVMIAILCVGLVTIVFLLLIVTQTVLYLVCKSYHREAIDKLSLSTFLSAYTEETVVLPKPGGEIQLGRVQAQVQPSAEMV
ncbi:uncharacterized protein LOC143555692 [Bidens hawaiensis]|uniref:uncharacterized protein LOC143555692 n=1 Tax=Bidens hawaiensis TaxID=980011 RepID=UPI00404BA02A